MIIKSTIKKIILLLLLVTGYSIVACSVNAQVSFQFQPALNGQTVNGLFTVQLQNTGLASYGGKVKITVRDGSNKQVLAALTPVIDVRPGSNTLSVTMLQSRIQFGNSVAAELVGQTGRFPEGEYEYCFEFTGIEKANAAEQVFENCFNWLVQSLLPLELLSPGDGDELCNLRPALIWQPALPLNNNLRYRVLLTEKKEGQQNADAIMNNVPVLQQDNIPGFVLQYPPQAPALQKDKNYVWQVIAYIGSAKLTQSEIWVFKTSCGDKKTDSLKESYRELSGMLNGNYYVVTGTLRFSITNPYGKTKMDYSITDLADPSKKIGNLSVVELQTGLNKIDISLEDVKGLEPDKTYLLTIKNIDHQPLYLRFLYKNDGQ